jgi:Sulfotransferase domain
MSHLAVRASARAYGSATATHRRLPDYLIIGAKKGGTSSLINWLLQHPDCLRMFPPVQRLKSAHFFDINYHRGERWYRGHFPVERARAPTAGPHTVVGEASPYYLFHPAAPARAAAVVPSAKILITLRNPVTRAHSNYWDRVAAGCESLPTFEDAVRAEEERSASVDHKRLVSDPRYYSYEHDNHSYLARGVYIEQVLRWYAHFPRAQVLVLCAEEMFADPARAFAGVEDFLGLRHTEGGVSFKVYNQRRNPPLDPRTRQQLAEYYRPHNHALYEFLGRDLGWT